MMSWPIDPELYGTKTIVESNMAGNRVSLLFGQCLVKQSVFCGTLLENELLMLKGSSVYTGSTEDSRKKRKSWGKEIQPFCVKILSGTEDTSWSSDSITSITLLFPRVPSRFPLRPPGPPEWSQPLKVNFASEGYCSFPFQSPFQPCGRQHRTIILFKFSLLSRNRLSFWKGSSI